MSIPMILFQDAVHLFARGLHTGTAITRIYVVY